MFLMGGWVGGGGERGVRERARTANGPINKALLTSQPLVEPRQAHTCRHTYAHTHIDLVYLGAGWGDLIGGSYLKQTDSFR